MDRLEQREDPQPAGDAPERRRSIDWQTAAGQIADQLSTSDGGVHLRTKKAQQFYANMIFDAVGRSDLDQPIE